MTHAATMNVIEVIDRYAPNLSRVNGSNSGNGSLAASRTMKRETLDARGYFMFPGDQCVEKIVAAAVFFQAAEDLQKFRDERCTAGRMLYGEMRDSITSNDRGLPGSSLQGRDYE